MPLFARRLASPRSLIIGVLCAALAAGCADENDPQTHVKRLNDPVTRSAAVSRLVTFFEDAMSKDNKDRNGPNVTKLLDQIIEPMTKACTSGDLDDKTQSKLIRFMYDARDKRGADCIVKALKEYKVDSTEEDVRWAARAAGALKLQAASAPLFEVFVKLRPSKPKASTIYRDVHDALIELNDKSWEPRLIDLLNRPIADRKDGAVLKDEAFWQITAAEILGNLKSAAAVKPLIKAVLSPIKADIAPTAVNALIKIGKPSVQPVVDLMNSADATKDLQEYSEQENLKAAQGPDGKVQPAAQKSAKTAHVGAAAIILGTIGREEGAAPMVAALGKVDDLSRAIIARELTKLPKSDATVKAFQETYEKTPLDLSIPPGINARESLLEASGNFFDASFVPWMIKAALSAKGDASDLEGLKQATLVTATKLMKADQVADVERQLYDLKVTGPDGKPTTLGKGLEAEFKLAKELLKACGDKAECYIAKLAEPASNDEKTQFQGIKAAYMVGVLGGESAKPKILEQMPKITHPAPRFVIASVLDAFSPKGDPAVAEKLQKTLDEAEASKDSNKISANAPLKTVLYRLGARAQ